MTFTHPENVIIDQPQQIPPFTGRLLDVQLAGTSKAYIDQNGTLFINGTPGTVGLNLNTQDVIGIRFIQNVERIVNYGSGDLFFEGYNAAWFAWHRFGFNMYSPPGFYGIEVHTLGAGIPTVLRLVDDQGQAANQGPKIMLAAQRITGGETDISAISGLITDIDNTNYKGALAFYTANAGAPAERMRIDHIGNVGIGTASPGAKLDVAGDLKVAGGFGNTGLAVDNNGTIQTNGNLQVRRDGAHGDPTLMYLGRAEQVQVVITPPTYEPGHLNYVFWQNRFNREGWYWAGWNTFRHPNTVPPEVPASSEPPPPTSRQIAWGYGYYPFRLWAKNALIEASGAIVSKQYAVAPQVFFQRPQHIDLVDGQARNPDGYDSVDRPFVWQPDPGVEPPGTTLTANINQSDLGPVPIQVQSTSDFSVGDEVFISDTTGQGGALRGEINEIQSKDSATQMTLKRGSSAFFYQRNGKVQRVREIGGIQQNTNDFGIKIVREGNELAFYDGLVSSGKRLARLITSLVNNVKVDKGESALNGVEVTDSNQTPTPYSIPANSTASLGTINLHTTFSSPFQYIVLLTPRNRLNSWGVSLTIQDRSNSSFSVLGRNDHPTLDAEFYIQWSL